MRLSIDVETTGLEQSDRICSVGLLMEDGVHYELIHPAKKIPPAASAIHHITNEMVKDSKPFERSDTYALLQTLNTPDNLLISHNAVFDLGMLEKEGIVWQGRVIDTLKCAKALMEDLDGYSLQYLRYELRLYRDEDPFYSGFGINPIPHHALSDAILTYRVYAYLLELADEERLMELSSNRLLLLRMPFGKYAQKRIEEVAIKDPGYLGWMLDNVLDMDEDLRYSIKHYLR